MDSEIEESIIILVSSLLLISLVRLAIPFKIKRVNRKCEYVRNNLNNKNVKKYIGFLRGNTLINVPEIGQALRETQLQINRADYIDGRLKLELYQVLMRKRVIGVQEVNPVFVEKNEQNVAK